MLALLSGMGCEWGGGEGGGVVAVKIIVCFEY